ncbi:MAG: c-type cytochrome [Pseudolabrys sp.]
MITRHFFAIFGAGLGLAVVAGPALAADDIEAKVQMCAACHGQNGVPTDPKTIPIIAGQQQSYLVKQLHDYRSGDRDNAVMSPIAKGLAQEDLRKIAAYFAAKSWPAQHVAGASAPPPNGIAQCQPCHQPNFEGGPPAPRLAGLSYEYLVAVMRSFAADERTNNGDMPKFMRALTDSERDAMARYLSAL